MPDFDGTVKEFHYAQVLSCKDHKVFSVIILWLVLCCFRFLCNVFYWLFGVVFIESSTVLMLVLSAVSSMKDVVPVQGCSQPSFLHCVLDDTCDLFSPSPSSPLVYSSNVSRLSALLHTFFSGTLHMLPWDDQLMFHFFQCRIIVGCRWLSVLSALHRGSIVSSYHGTRSYTVSGLAPVYLISALPAYFVFLDYHSVRQHYSDSPPIV